MKSELIKKLTSRKFIVTVITAITGIITMFIGENEMVQTVAGAAMAIVPTIVYCFMEGTIDAKSLQAITDATTEAAGKLGASDALVGTIEQIGEAGEILVSEEISEE